MWTYSYIMKEHDSDDKKIKFKGTAGSAETPRVIDSNNQADIQQGTGEGFEYLATEGYFEKYWHLLPSERYDPCNIIEQVYNHTQDTSIGIHGSKLKAAATSLSSLAGTLNSQAQTLEGQLNADDEATRAAKEKVTALKEAASKAGHEGLKQLLTDLDGASGFDDVVAKAKLVLAKYNEVAIKYGKVAEDKTAKSKDAFDQVKTAFDALQTEFDMIKRLDKFFPSLLSGLIS